MLALVIFQYTVMHMNGYPGVYKSKIMRGNDGNLRSNMFIYKLATQQGDEGSAIVMHEDGDLGQYNRANRSIYHFMENSLSFVAALPLSFSIYYVVTIFSIYVLFMFSAGSVPNERI